MQKIIQETNAINWFEIPVTDIKRAKSFYENILDIEMQSQFIEETKEESAFFPFTGSKVRATSGRVSGILVKNNHNKPSALGTMVYLNANPDIQIVLGKVESAGGKILIPMKKIIAGSIAVIMDTEGNRVGLHSNK